MSELNTPEFKQFIINLIEVFKAITGWILDIIKMVYHISSPILYLFLTVISSIIVFIIIGKFGFRGNAGKIAYKSISKIYTKIAELLSNI